MTVPKHLIATTGKPEIVRSLQTRDLATAKRKLHAAMADIRRELATAEANRTLPPESAEYILEAAREARRAVTTGLLTEGQAEVGPDASVERQLNLLRAKHGEDEDGDPVVGEAQVRAIRLARKVRWRASNAALGSS